MLLLENGKGVEQEQCSVPLASAQICSCSQVLTLWCLIEAYEFSRPVIKTWARTGTAQSIAGTVISPLPGKVIKVYPVKYYQPS